MKKYIAIALVVVVVFVAFLNWERIVYREVSKIKVEPSPSVIIYKQNRFTGEYIMEIFDSGGQHHWRVME